MEHGFFHPDSGYWQTLGEVPPDILSGYPEGTIEVPLKPGADHEWRDGEWVYVDPPPEPAPDRITARQFKLQLLASGLFDQVEGWIAIQPKAVQIAYATSATFVRTEPMMQSGFAALGFTPAQIDTFFIRAGKI